MNCLIHRHGVACNDQKTGGSNRDDIKVTNLGYKSPGAVPSNHDRKPIHILQKKLKLKHRKA